MQPVLLATCYLLLATCYLTSDTMERTSNPVQRFSGARGSISDVRAALQAIRVRLLTDRKHELACLARLAKLLPHLRNLLVLQDVSLWRAKWPAKAVEKKRDLRVETIPIGRVIP